MREPTVDECYRSLEDKPFESHYMYVETIIERPVSQVWPHALNIGGWMTAHRLETLSGEPGTVGHFEKVIQRSVGADVSPPHYHLYGIAKIIPCKYIALEVFPEKGGSYGNTREWMSFDGILLTDMGKRTQVVFLMVDAHIGQGGKEQHNRRAKVVDDGQAMIRGYFENLRTLVEDQP
jgi:hypothetical protein